MNRVENGKYVKLCYTAMLENGDVVDRSESCQPLEIRVGAGEIIQGLEDGIMGMGLNEKKTITVGPDKAYGERDERLQRTILRSNFAQGFEPKVGEIVAFRTPKGEQLPAVIKSIVGEEVTVDFNHPLAGRSMVFEVEIAEINDQPSSSPSTCGTGCCCS